ncbi:MAG TPA: GntR family transcriptional regulator [Candidatus Paceibacterota bacterium]|nr:GntR family transcriptional regulator [Candidatus Paceibacterota bacterium]
MPNISGLPQPLYEQASIAITKSLREGVYRPGSRLPSERVMSQALGVSRLTLRHALANLVKQGLVEQTQTRGWFAAQTVSEGQNQLLSFSAMGELRGLKPSTQIIESQVHPASIEESITLRIAPGSDVFDLTRLRMLDGIPISVDRSRLSLQRFSWLSNIDFRKESLYNQLEKHDCKPTHADYVISVEDADQKTAELLQVEIGKGLLLSNGTTFDQVGFPISLDRILYRSDRYRLQTRLNRDSSNIFTDK